MMTDHPELFDGMRLVPCAVMTDERIIDLFNKWFDPDDGGNYLDCWEQCARAVEAEVRAEAQERPAWRDHPAAIDSKALATAQEIALMWGHDRSNFISRIQVAVTDAMVWIREAAQTMPPAPCPKRPYNGRAMSVQEHDEIVEVLQAKVAELEQAYKDKDDAVTQLVTAMRDMAGNIKEQATEIERLTNALNQPVILSEWQQQQATIAQQAALIEQLEKALHRVCSPAGDWDNGINQAEESLNAIAAHRGQS